MNFTPGERDAAPAPSRPPEPVLRPAAFFGLDKTLIPGSSLMALAQGLYERDFYGRYDVVRFAYRRFLFRFRRSEATPHFESSTQEALEFVAGHTYADMRALAAEIGRARIVPAVYRDMAMLVDQHRSDGIATFVTTAAPVELAEVVADGLGMSGALGTCAEVDDHGRYTGRLAGPILHGEAKASAVEAHATATGVDLSVSSAYSDSINDLPLLELVGKPEAVNPDRHLRKVANQRGWPVRELRGPVSQHRRTTSHVIHRLGTLGLQSPLHAEPDQKSRGPTHRFTVEDAGAFIRELEDSGRFRRDTRMGALFHRGHISLREVAPSHSLHITVGLNNRVSAHVDRYSPLAKVQRDDVVPRYSLARVAAHNITGMAADAARLIPGRRRPRTWADPPRVTRGERVEDRNAS